MHDLLIDGWISVPLGDLAQLRRGITYESSELVSDAGGLPYVNMKSFLKGGGFNREGTKTYSGKYSPSDILQTHDIFLANTDVTAGDIVGVPALLPSDFAEQPTLFSHHVTRARLRADIMPEFLCYLLFLPEYRSQMLRIARGTTVLMLDMQALKRVPIRFPAKLTVQSRIAEILSTVDEAIEQTEALIAKTQQIKAGLMHDLFTRGVTADGQLRPPREEAPRLYKESPLGWIPKEWDFGRLRTRAVVKGGKRLPAGHQFSEEPTAFRYLHTTDFIGRSIAYERMTHIRRHTFDALRRYEILAENIYISIAGVNLGWAGVFRPIITDQTILTENAAKILLNGEDSPEFVATQINAPSVQRQVQVETGIGAGVPKLALFRILSLWLAWPDRTEQDRICERCLSVNFQLNAQREENRNLLDIRRGLMQDLLTGRVPVTADATREPADAAANV